MHYVFIAQDPAMQRMMTRDNKLPEVRRSSAPYLACERIVIKLAFKVASFITENRMLYVDPSTGSLLWQIMVAGVVGGLFSIRRVLTATKALKRGLFGKLGVLFGPYSVERD